MEYSFVITREQGLLEQYYNLREQCFRRDLGVANFDGSEDEYDRDGTVLLAVDRQRRVIAGARIYGNHPGQGRHLPLENRRFRLRNWFPRLDLGWRPYCCWGRFAIDPGMRSRSFAREFVGRVIDCSAQLGYEYAFMVTDRKRSRYYRQLHRANGCSFHICDADVPSTDQNFGELEHLVSYAVLPSCDSPAAPPVRRGSEPFLRDLEFGARASNDVLLRVVEGGSIA